MTAPWLHFLSRGATVMAIACCLVPLLALVVSAATGDWAPAHAIQESFPRTLILTLTAATTAGLIGSALAFACAQLPYRARVPLMILLTVPIILPTYVLALAWSVWILPVIPLGQNAISTASTGVLPTIWVWAAALYPLPLWATYVAVRRWNAAWSDVASAHGVAPGLRGRLFARYLMAPVGAALILIWLLMLSDFAVPDFFRVSVYGTEVFIELSSYGNVRGAIVASIPCVVVAFGMMFALARLWHRWRVTADAIDRSKTVVRQVAHVDRTRVGAATIAAAGALLFVVAPLLAIIHAAADFDAFLALWPSLWRDAMGSAALSLALIGVVMPLASITAYATQRGVIRRTAAVQGVLAATFSVPSALLGLAGIALWNWPGTVGVVYTSGAALVLALIARWLPLAHELQHSGFRSVPASFEEAAWASGVSWSQAARHIVIRLSLGPLLATATLIFVLAFNDLTLTALLAPPGWSTLPLRVFSTVHYGSPQTLAATCLWQLLFLFAPVTILAWLGRRTLARV